MALTTYMNDSALMITVEAMNGSETIKHTTHDIHRHIKEHQASRHYMVSIHAAH